jgi:hypothetical protein
LHAKSAPVVGRCILFNQSNYRLRAVCVKVNPLSHGDKTALLQMIYQL